VNAKLPYMGANRHEVSLASHHSRFDQQFDLCCILGLHSGPHAFWRLTSFKNRPHAWKQSDFSGHRRTTLRRVPERHLCVNVISSTYCDTVLYASFAAFQAVGQT